MLLVYIVHSFRTNSVTSTGKDLIVRLFLCVQKCNIQSYSFIPFIHSFIHSASTGYISELITVFPNIYTLYWIWFRKGHDSLQKNFHVYRNLAHDRESSSLTFCLICWFAVCKVFLRCNKKMNKFFN